MSKRQHCCSCDSSDGLAIYNNGSYCFACKELKNRKTLLDNRQSLKNAPFAGVFTNLLKDEIEYLSQFELTNQDIIDYNITHEVLSNRICFAYNKEAFWLRSLTNQPKWLYKGIDKSSYVWLYQHHYPNDKVCIVEDVISAIKVSKFMDCICLGGTNINESILEILNTYNCVYLFLDGDVAGRNAKELIRNKTKLIIDVFTVRNTKDPKTYTYNELERFLC